MKIRVLEFGLHPQTRWFHTKQWAKTIGKEELKERDKSYGLHHRSPSHALRENFLPIYIIIQRLYKWGWIQISNAWIWFENFLLTTKTRLTCLFRQRERRRKQPHPTWSYNGLREEDGLQSITAWN